MPSQNSHKEQEKMDFTYSCSICDSKFPLEVFARTHMYWCDDIHHNWCDGFMPEAEVNVIDTTGEYIYSKEGDGRFVQDIKLSDLPDNISNIDKHIIIKSINSRNVKTYTEIVKQVNKSLQSKGLEKRSYSHIVSQIKSLFDINTHNKTELGDNSEKSIVNSKVPEWYTDINISDEGAKIVEYFANNPESQIYDVAKELDYSISYIVRIEEDFAELILERGSDLGSDVKELKRKVNELENRRAQNWDDLSKKQKETLRVLSMESNPRNPDSSLREISRKLDFESHPAYIEDVSDKYIDFAVELKESREKINKENDSSVQIIELEQYVQSLKKISESEYEKTENEFTLGKIHSAERFELYLDKVKNTDDEITKTF